jgi:hypothetical protein
MKEIRTEIIINADAPKIWNILTDFSGYSKWNPPFIKNIKGKLEIGSRLEVKLQPPNKKVSTFKPKILNLEPNRELKWLGKLNGLGFLFSGEHHFTLIKNDNHSTKLIQSEKFKGILTLFMRSVFLNTTKGFIEFNKALKERSEI